MKKFLFLLSVLLILSCSDDNIGKNSKISNCGGFKTNGIMRLCDSKVEKIKPKIVTLNERDDKCKDYLKWEYNPKSKVLSLTHLNAYLNCCGNRYISVTSNDNNHYTILEEDEPAGFGARCDCMCTYSFYTELHDIKKSIIKIDIKQDIKEESRVKTILSSAVINLNQAEKGDIFINEFYSMGSCNK